MSYFVKEVVGLVERTVGYCSLDEVKERLKELEGKDRKEFVCGSSDNSPLSDKEIESFVKEFQNALFTQPTLLSKDVIEDHRKEIASYQAEIESLKTRLHHIENCTASLSRRDYLDLLRTLERYDTHFPRYKLQGFNKQLSQLLRVVFPGQPFFTDEWIKQCQSEPAKGNVQQSAPNATQKSTGAP